MGKTTSSSALGVKMADDGYKTVIVSTDPAHSLGDALQMDLKGGGLSPVSGICLSRYYTRSLLRRYGIGFLVVCPGFVVMMLTWGVGPDRDNSAVESVSTVGVVLPWWCHDHG